MASLIVAVPILAIARSIWPDIVLFGPTSSYLRLVPFIMVPLAAATAAFAKITSCSATPQRTFLILAGIVLLLSFVPDYILPVAGRTFVASSVAAFLHIVVAIVTVSVLLIGYRRSAAPATT